MDVAMMQPSFLPWQGFFELIYQADVFVFLDDFQFSLQSYHQRNRLFVNQGQVDWYTVPVRKSESFKALLSETMINDSIPWRQKFWKRIQQNYSKTPYYKTISPVFEEWLLTPKANLAIQNIDFIQIVTNLLGLRKNFRYSSQFATSATRSQRVLEILRWCNAKRYFCAKGSFGYMLEDGVFPLSDIEVVFQNFVPVEYFQVGSKNMFIPYLSILDAIFNIGPEQTLELVKNGTRKWLTWRDMLSCHTFHEMEEHLGH